jgi:YD repeat-containing protein
LKKSILRRTSATLAAASLTLCLAATTLAQQGGTARYVYDDSGRLHAVISPTGEAVVYDYDAAGNLTAVRRLAADALAIFTFSPHEGVHGDLVTLVGVGFGAGVNEVSFNGAAARVVEVTPTTVVAEVPQGATTGPITVTTPRGSASTPSPFTVRGVRVTPETTRIVFGGTVQFVAVAATATGDTTLAWTVNGIQGGDSTVGTITAGGLYTAPSSAGSFVVRASLVSEPTLFDEAVVNVINPEDVGQPRAPGVSVMKGLKDGTRIVGNNNLSVRYGYPQGATAATAVPLSVRRGNADGISTLRSEGTSVRYGATGLEAETRSAHVSVGYGGAEAQTAASASVSATRGPYVASISPDPVTRGTTVTLTISGANLSDATAVRFLNSSGTIPGGMTVTNISVNAEGTVLTATLTVTSTTAVGQYTLVVITPAGSSGGNPIQIN